MCEAVENDYLNGKLRKLIANYVHEVTTIVSYVYNVNNNNKMVDSIRDETDIFIKWNHFIHTQENVQTLRNASKGVGGSKV